MRDDPKTTLTDGSPVTPDHREIMTDPHALAPATEAALDLYGGSCCMVETIHNGYRQELVAAIVAEREQARREALEEARLVCISEQRKQGARRHGDSYSEGMEIGASNCRVRIESLIHGGANVDD